MVSIIDNRFKNTCRLKDIEAGQCFICDGILFRKLYGCHEDNVEYMYSGMTEQMDISTIVTPVDVTIIIDNEEEFNAMAVMMND